MAAAEWEDGRSTAGSQSALVKRNEQLPVDGALARELGRRIISALMVNPLFISASVPLHIFPPLFNRYGPGQYFGEHVDNAIRGDQLTGLRIRTDLSATLFLSEPDEYEGGELIIKGYHGEQQIKLSAGHLVLYPSTTLHLVNPVTRGERISSFFWLQSMVKDTHARGMIFDLDNTIQDLIDRLGRDTMEVRRLTNIYHNLIRYWAEL